MTEAEAMNSSNQQSKKTYNQEGLQVCVYAIETQALIPLLTPPYGASSNSAVINATGGSRPTIMVTSQPDHKRWQNLQPGITMRID